MSDQIHDFWTQTFADTADVRPLAGRLRQVAKVTPFSRDAAKFKTELPDVLKEPLFGSIDGTEANLESYAILDAAKIPELPTLLENSGLEHRCLYKGEALRDFGHVAPWIIKLQQENRFLPRLFTEGPPPFGLWHPEFGIFLRSQAALDELWQHFRKFVKLKDDRGKWYYFRFWEPHLLPILNQQSHAVLYPTRSLPLLAVVAPTSSVTHILEIDQKADLPLTASISSQLRDSIDRGIETRFANSFGETLARTAPVRMRKLGLQDSSAVARMVSVILDQLEPLGFRKRSDIARIAACGFFYGTYFLLDPRIAPLAERFLVRDQRDPSLRARDFLSALQQDPVAARMLDAASIRGLASRLANDRNSPPTRVLFAQICEAQQPNGLSNVKRTTHLILAEVLTPYFLADPLTQTWQRIFSLPDDAFLSAVHAEIERMLNSDLGASPDE